MLGEELERIAGEMKATSKFDPREQDNTEREKPRIADGSGSDETVSLTGGAERGAVLGARCSNESDEQVAKAKHRRTAGTIPKNIEEQHDVDTIP